MSTYTPDTGDVVWLDFDPSLGSEQNGRRPAVIISALAFNKFGICYAVPITSKTKGYMTEVPIKLNSINGVALTNQLTALDWRQRRCDLAGQISSNTLDQIKGRLRALLGV